MVLMFLLIGAALILGWTQLSDSQKESIKKNTIGRLSSSEDDSSG